MREVFFRGAGDDDQSDMRFLRVIQVVVVACGCGGNAGHGPDAGPPIDGATAAPVTLSVKREGQAVAGVRVYFLNPDDSVAAKLDTDATGAASAMVADGGSVTVLDAFAPAQPDPTRAIELRTYIGVKAGDHLVVALRDPPPMAVTIKAPLLSGRHSYDVLTSCGTSSLSATTASGTITLSGCHGVADILVMATASLTGERVALYRAGVAVADGGTVDLTAETFAPLRDATFHCSHLPSDTKTVSVLQAIVTEHGTLGLNSVVFDGAAANIQQGEATVTFQIPDVENSTALIDYNIHQQSHHVVTEHRPRAASYDLDVAGLLLPDRTMEPVYDAATRRLVWSEAPGGVVPDLDLGFIIVTSAATPTQSWNWQTVAPHTGTALRIPALPADPNIALPAPGDPVKPEGLVTLKLPGGYDAIRARVYDETQLDTFERMLQPGERLLKIED